MKIAVITPFDSANFGAYLQAYCLKKYLEDRHHTVYHVRTRSKAYVDRLFVRKLPAKYRHWPLSLLFKKQQEYGKRKGNIFRKAWTEFDVREEIPADTDCCVLGSDEIWNIRRNAFRQSVFWGNSDRPALAYAVSAGQATTEDFDRWPVFGAYMRSLSRIFVRDENTQSIVKHTTGFLPELVCDPTFLVQQDTYGEEYTDPFLQNHHCLLIYSYKLSRAEQKVIQKYAKQKGLKTVSVCFYHPWCDHQIECSPLAFSSVIRQCKAVITTTFHGTIFCILNHADYLTVSDSNKTVHLHKTMNLTDRIVSHKRFSCDLINDTLGKKTAWEEVDQKVGEMKSQSAALLDNALKEIVPTFQYVICPPEECTACFACQSVCPKEAIEVSTDAHGKTLPFIIHDKCIHCGKCKSVCPQRKPPAAAEPQMCYAAQLPDEQERSLSSSGAIAAVITKTMLNEGAVIFGAAAEEFTVRHKEAGSVQEAEAFRGSKYVQSSMDGVIRKVLVQLQEGKKVVFFGTPCQVAGVRSATERWKDQITCIDIICHGVPPAVYFEQHLKKISKNVTGFSFREDKSFVLKVEEHGKTVYRKMWIHDTYYYAFMKTMVFRANCYQCRYASPRRIGDITVGDFWGLDRNKLKTKQAGRISVVLVNTEKGEQVWRKIQDQLTWEPRELQEAQRKNPQLKRPSIPHRYRERFLSAYEKTKDFDRAFLSKGIRYAWNVERAKNIYLYKKMKKAFRRLKKKAAG